MFFFSLITGIVLLTTSCKHSEPVQLHSLPASSEVIKFISPNNNEKPLFLHTYRPDHHPLQELVIVIPGVHRNAAEYLSVWKDIADSKSLLIVVPEFKKEFFPGSEEYQWGGVFDPETNELRPPEKSSFQILEDAFDFLREYFSLPQDSYSLYGHSGGAQFVHRFLMLQPEHRAHRAIAANAGWYTFVNDSKDYPLAYKNIPPSRLNLPVFFEMNFTVLNGELDNNPDHKFLNKDPEIQLQQGLHRLERGGNYFNDAKKQAASKNLKFNWSRYIVPQSGHSNRKMSAYSAAYWFSD